MATGDGTSGTKKYAPAGWRLAYHSRELMRESHVIMGDMGVNSESQCHSEGAPS